MNKHMKRILLIGVAAFLSGGIIASAAFFTGKVAGAIYFSEGDLMTLDLTRTTQSVTEGDLEPFDNVRIVADSTSVQLDYGDYYGLHAFYSTNDVWDYTLDYRVENGTLIVQAEEFMKTNVSGGTFLNYSDMGYYSHSLTIFLPKDTQMKGVQIESRYASVEVPALKADSLEITGTYGNITLTNCQVKDTVLNLEDCNTEIAEYYGDTLTCRNTYANMSFSNKKKRTFQKVDLDLSDVNLVAEHLDVKNLSVTNCYANMELRDMTLGNMDAELSDVNVWLADVSADMVNMENYYATVEAERFTTGGLVFSGKDCSINIGGTLTGTTAIDNSYGHITLDLTGVREDYAMVVDTTYSDVYVDGALVGSGDDITLFFGEETAPNPLRINHSDGTVEIRFEK